jgi:hypothetical protein
MMSIEFGKAQNPGRYSCPCNLSVAEKPGNSIVDETRYAGDRVVPRTSSSMARILA